MEFGREKSNTIKSESVDGLGTRVDLPDRVMYLEIDKTEIFTEWLPAIYFADWLDIRESQVVKIISKLQIEGRYDEKINAIIFPPITYQLVKEELQWLKMYAVVDARITPAVMGELLGRDYRYVTKEALNLGYSLRNNKFSKIALSAMRNKELSIPFDEGWYTLGGLTVETNRDRDWVKNRLDESGIIPEKRRSLNSGITLDYYPPESLDYINNCAKKIPEYGDDWYTRHRICEETGKSGHWVSERLKAYIGMSEIRLDDMGVGRPHYPKSVFQSLLVEAEKTVAVPKSGDWMTIKVVANRMGIDEKSVKRKFDALGIMPEIRKTDAGKTVYHYNPSEVDLVINEMENFISESALARKIGKSVYLTCVRLKKMGIMPIDSRYYPETKKLYPINVIDILKDID